MPVTVKVVPATTYTYYRGPSPYGILYRALYSRNYAGVWLLRSLIATSATAGADRGQPAVPPCQTNRGDVSAEMAGVGVRSYLLTDTGRFCIPASPPNARRAEDTSRGVVLFRTVCRPMSRQHQAGH